MKQVNKQISLSVKICSYLFYMNSRIFIKKYILIIFKKPKNIKMNIKSKDVKNSEIYKKYKIMTKNNNINVLRYN